MFLASGSVINFHAVKLCSNLPTYRKAALIGWERAGLLHQCPALLEVDNAHSRKHGDLRLLAGNIEIAGLCVWDRIILLTVQLRRVTGERAALHSRNGSAYLTERMRLLCSEGNARLSRLLAKGPEGDQPRHIRNDRNLASLEYPARKRTDTDTALNKKSHVFHGNKAERQREARVTAKKCSGRIPISLTSPPNNFYSFSMLQPLPCDKLCSLKLETGN